MTVKNTKKGKGNGPRGRRYPGEKLLKAVSPFPPHQIRRFKYSERYALNEAAAAAGAYQVMAISSLYDPDSSGVGHQPLYFDQLFSSTGPYTQYRVLSCDVRVTFTSAVAAPATVGLYFQPSVTGPTSLAQAMEKPMSKWNWVSGSTGGPSVTVLTARADVASVLGVTKQHLRNDDYYAGAYNSGPTKPAYAILWMYGTTVTASIYCTVELDFVADCFTLAAIGSS